MGSTVAVWSNVSLQFAKLQKDKIWQKRRTAFNRFLL